MATTQSSLFSLLPKTVSQCSIPKLLGYNSVHLVLCFGTGFGPLFCAGELGISEKDTQFPKHQLFSTTCPQGQISMWYVYPTSISHNFLSSFCKMLKFS